MIILKFLTKHMQETFEKDSCPDFFVFGYIQKLFNRYDYLTDKQLDYLFDILYFTDRYQLEPDEDVLIDLIDIID